MSGADDEEGPDIFDQRSYWVARHERLRDDPRSVGNLGRGIAENRAAERVIQTWMVQAAGLLSPYRSVIDIGCGYGRVAGVFCDAGFAYTGIDISPVAIASARELEPRGTFRAQSALTLTDEGRFDLALALYVFVHFVVEAEWRALIGVLARALRPGGGLLIADTFPPETVVSAPHATHRPLALYEEALRAEGLRLDREFPYRLQHVLDPRKTRVPSVQLARKLD